MAALQDSDVEELTSSLMAGLKSWLAMGMSMAPMSGDGTHLRHLTNRPAATRVTNRIYSRVTHEVDHYLLVESYILVY